MGRRWIVYTHPCHLKSAANNLIYAGARNTDDAITFPIYAGVRNTDDAIVP